MKLNDYCLSLHSKKIAIKSFLIKKEFGLFYGVLVQKNAEKLFFYILTYIFIVGKLLL